jgi:MFS family permease
MTISSDLTAQPAPVGSRPRPARSRSTGYGRTFWFTYIANLSLMVAVSLLYRYADFVTALRGNELNLGWIVGLGMTGSLFMRFGQAGGIERFGDRKIWLCSLALMVAGLAGNLLVTTVDGPLIYLLRIAFSTGVAGALGASITFVSRSMPVPHMAEVIGTLGTSGFLAMLIGPMIGDALCGTEIVPRSKLDLMFLIAAGLGVFSFLCAAIATHGDAPPPRRRRPHVFWLLSRYRPGPILLVGVAVGIGAALPAVFLTTYSDKIGVPRIADFFLVYASTALVARLITLRLPHRFGVVPMICGGMAAQIISLLAYLVVDSAWKLAIPGFFGGVAHALLFPSVVAGGSGGFPNRYRGLGTIVMLATVDVGNVIGAPLVGGLLYYSESIEWEPYPTMFVTIAAALTAITLFYALATRGRIHQPARERQAAVPVRL